MKVTKRQLRRIIKEQAIDYEARDKKDLSDVYDILTDLEGDLMIDAGEGTRKGDTFEQRQAGKRARDHLEMLQTAIFKLEEIGVTG